MGGVNKARRNRATERREEREKARKEGRAKCFSFDTNTILKLARNPLHYNFLIRGPASEKLMAHPHPESAACR